MAELNQQRFILATDEIIELRNGAKQCQHFQKYVLVWCVKDMVRGKEYCFENGETQTGRVE